MPNRNIIFMQGLKVSPNEEPQEFDAELSNLRNAIESIEAFGHIKPFGESAININYNALGKSSDFRFNRTIIDGNGKQQVEIYGIFYLSYRTLALPSPDEIAMYKHLFSLEECAKPIEERIKTIKEYFPSGVEGVLMPDPNNIPEANRKYITHPTDTPSYTQPVTPSRTPAVPVKNKDYTPHCPICGSPDIEKITLAQKAFGGIMFGLFSKTAKSQFKCNNCGAKF